MNQEPPPSYDALEQARLRPNSWIYEVDGAFGPNDFIPPKAIVGAWWADYAGKIVGSFLRNPNYAKGSNFDHDSNATLHFPGGF